MAIVEVKVPQLSESVAEATLLQWKKKPGEAVAADEILIEIETDKVVMEVPAPSAGVLAEIVVGDGGTVAFARTGTEVTADAGTPILDAAEEAGVLMPSVVSSGQCPMRPAWRLVDWSTVKVALAVVVPLGLTALGSSAPVVVALVVRLTMLFASAPSVLKLPAASWKRTLSTVMTLLALLRASGVKVAV